MLLSRHEYADGIQRSVPDLQVPAVIVASPQYDPTDSPECCLEGPEPFLRSLPTLGP